MEVRGQVHGFESDEDAHSRAAAGVATVGEGVASRTGHRATRRTPQPMVARRTEIDFHLVRI